MLGHVFDRIGLRRTVPPVSPDEARESLSAALPQHFEILPETRALWAEGELDKELHPAHEMQGTAWYAVARAKRGDTYLFYGEDGRLALVHLTFSGFSDRRPEHPLAAVMSDLPAGIRRLRGFMPKAGLQRV